MKSSVKHTQNFGLVKGMYNGLKHWLSKAKLFFIRSVAHSKNPPLCDKSDIIDNQFYTPKEVIETLLKVMENPKFNQNTLANHLSILSIAFSKSQHYQNEELGNKFYRDLYQLCQNHISNQKVTREI